MTWHNNDDPFYCREQRAAAAGVDALEEASASAQAARGAEIETRARDKAPGPAEERN